MSENKGPTEDDKAIGFAIMGMLVMAIAVITVPIAVLSMPMALVLKSMMEDQRPLPSFCFALAVMGITYFFMFGFNDHFNGIVFEFGNDLLHRTFNAVVSYFPKKWQYAVEYPTHMRRYLYITFPIGFMIAFYLKIKEDSKIKSQRDYFQGSQSNGLKNLVTFLYWFCFPFTFVATFLKALVSRLFSTKLRAGLFYFAGVVFFYELTYLTFGEAYSWHIKFGYFLNHMKWFFKLFSPDFMNFIKWYMYLAGCLFPLVLLMRKDMYAFDIVAPMVFSKIDKSNGNVYLGRDQNGRPLYLTPKMLNHHVHVVGASGFGKTTFLLNIIKDKIKGHESLIFVDLKGDIDTVCEFASFCESADRITDFEFFSISEEFLSVSKGINLFENGNALEIKDKIMGAFKYDHDYYKKRVESFLNLSLRALVYLRDKTGEQFNLESVYKLILGFEHIEELASKIDSKEIKDDLESLIVDKKLKEDLTGLRADIEGLIKTDFGYLLSNSGINLYESMRDNKIVYIHLDSQRYEASAEKLGRLILQELKTASAKIVTTTTKYERSPITLIVDEFANLATDQFVGFLNKARASGIGIVIGHQELSDLEVFSPTVKDQIMTNTSTLFSFLQKLPKSAEMIAGIGGTFQNIKETSQTEETGMFFKSKEETGLGSMREVEEYIVHPNLIKELEVGQCFMISKYPSTYIAKCFVDYQGGYNMMDKYRFLEILAGLNNMSPMKKQQYLIEEKREEQDNYGNEPSQSEDWL